jgi:hypothetical protein
LQEVPFEDIEYSLGHEAVLKPFEESQLVALSIDVNCGPMLIEFVDENDQALDPVTFSVLNDTFIVN